MSAARIMLEDIVAAEVARPVSPRVVAMAKRVRQTWGDGVVAVLFYGSCLRDGVEVERILDLYVLTDDYRSIHSNVAARAANALLPPNVYYHEEMLEGRTLVAKCATISLKAFERRMHAFHPYFWARFSQPCALLWVRDELSRKRVVAALARAVRTLVTETQPLVSTSADNVWIRGFTETYRSELRSESGSRSADLFAADAARYDRVAAIVARDPPAGDAGLRRSAAMWRWRGRRVVGKTLSVLRLIKAAYTFRNGALYLVWKIRRHSGISVELSPWQQRHPILAAGILFFRLYKKRAFR